MVVTDSKQTRSSKMRKIQKANSKRPFRPTNVPEEAYALLSLLQRVPEVSKLSSQDSICFSSGIINFNLGKDPYILYSINWAEPFLKSDFHFSLWAKARKSWAFQDAPVESLIEKFLLELHNYRKDIQCRMK